MIIDMNKLLRSAKSQPILDQKEMYIAGFKEAFKLINVTLDEELKLLEKYPSMGERLMTLKIYRKKINDLLKDMEQEYV